MKRPPNILKNPHQGPWWLWLVVFSVFAFTVPVIAVRLAIVLQASTWRQVTDPVYPLPPEEDGSIVVTLAGDRPIDLATPNPDFVREDANTFTTRFPWNWQSSRTVVFVDDLNE